MRTRLMKKLIALTISTITIMGISAQSASAEWKQGSHGWWNAKGQSYSVGWEKIGDSWFFFDKDGYMKSGWISDGGKWYFLNPNGYMVTGWLNDGSKWYYLNPNGDMAANTSIGSYQLGTDGAWVDNSGVNTTTGAAAQVTIGPEVNVTTGPAVIIVPNNNSHKEDKEKQKLGKFLEKLDDKANKRIDKAEDKINKIEEKEDKFLKHINKLQ